MTTSLDRRHLALPFVGGLFSLVLLSSPLLAQDEEAQPTSAASEGRDLPDVSGKWAQLQVTTSISDIPVVGDVSSTTTSLLIVDIAQDGEKLRLTETVCAVKIDTGSTRIRTIIPKAFLRATSGLKRPATLSSNGDGTFAYTQPKTTAVIGAKLKNTRKDALPEDEDDPRVVDSDRDGHPGVTVKVRGAIDGDIYVAQRGWSKMTGTLQGQHVKGRIRWGMEQSVLDSTSMFLRSSPDAVPDKRASHNFFKMRKIKDSADCAMVNKAGLAIFE